MSSFTVFQCSHRGQEFREALQLSVALSEKILLFLDAVTCKRKDELIKKQKLYQEKEKY